jgi:hypothetical protein
MKPWMHLGSSSIGLGLAPALLALVTGCSSSSSSPAMGGGDASSSGGGEAGSGADASIDGPPFDGPGMACTPNAHETVAAKITLAVNWPQTLANGGCLASKGCTGDINIWLLAHYDISGNAITGSTVTCSNVTPSIPLSALGSQSEGLPAGQTAKVLINFDPATWTAVAANKPATPTTGTLGGWNVGSSLQMDPTTSVYGLKSTSPLNSATAVWPASESTIAASDLADDDNDGKPGITATPSNTNGNSLPATALMTSPPFAPQADKLYLVLRTQLALRGYSTSCTDMEGVAESQVLNNHVVGCHVSGMGECVMAQWDFIDGNSTVYVGPGVKIPAGTPAASFTPQQIHGTFKSKILSTDADGGGIDCAAVLAALP